MPKDFKVQRLSDEFGQYLLVIKCAGCAHERRAFSLPQGRGNGVKSVFARNPEGESESRL